MNILDSDLPATPLKSRLPRTWGALLRPPRAGMKGDGVWYSFFMLKSNFSERRGKLPELDRSFVLTIWR